MSEQTPPEPSILDAIKDFFRSGFHAGQDIPERSTESEIPSPGSSEIKKRQALPVRWIAAGLLGLAALLVAVFYVAGWPATWSAPSLFAEPTPPHVDLRDPSGRAMTIVVPRLDTGQPADAFDGNGDSLMRGAQDNPFVVVIRLETAEELTGLDLHLASALTMQVTVQVAFENGDTAILEQNYTGPPLDPILSFDFPEHDSSVESVQIDITDLREEPEGGYHIHIREITLR